ncbi:MAG: nucleotidyl transferase [Acidobacteria bacterium]|nr:MAG: nucleotidyl transferase [Acidobacteriota bacterium]
MKAVALVGGQGTRLRPLTFRTPKPLLPLVNRPLLEFVVERCKRNEISDLVLSTNYLPDLFRVALGDSLFGVEIEYIHELDALGTAGGVKNCEGAVDGTFYVFNGDVLTGLDLVRMLEFHRSKGAAVTLYLTPVEDPRAYGVVPLDDDGRVTAFIEKPSLADAPTNMINGGVYIIEPEILAEIPRDEPYSFERQLFPDLVAGGAPIYGYESDAYWIDIGTPEKYLQAHLDVLTGALQAEIPGEEITPGVWVAGGVEIDEGASVTAPAVIGDGTRVEAGARLEGPVSIGAGCVIGANTSITRSALADGVEIGRSCTIENALIGEASVVEQECTIAELAVVGPGASISEGNELRRGMRVWPDVEVGPSSIQF